MSSNWHLAPTDSLWPRGSASGREGRVSGAAGFTLLRLVLVLLVTALLTVIVAPTVTGTVDRLARAREERMLRTLVAGLKGHVFRHRSIPTGPGFVPAVASELRVPSDRVRRNARSLQRAFLLHPQFEDVVSLPYQQGGRGVAELAPEKMKAVLVSCLSQELPARLVTGSPISAEEFMALWDSESSAVPTVWDWAGGWDDLQIERVDLADLFVEVHLCRLGRSAGHKARFAVDGKGAGADPAASGDFRSHYLRGSVLELYDDNGQQQTLSVTAVLREGASFVCEAGHWSRGGPLACGTGIAQEQPAGGSADASRGKPHDG